MLYYCSNYLYDTSASDEGLPYVSENRSSLAAGTSGILKKDEYGRYTDGDILYAEVCGDIKDMPFVNPSDIHEKDGHKLMPILKFYDIPDTFAKQLKQQIIFK